ncbi:MAG: 23S rRNA (pseudouridine(1915)-N(3))-methyltransferase RlmH [Clostridia bacterium]|nr:23S rRNA (pseudouridine(1915)-N(3))-methyltransferase RlmH [Clostridia bacterium]
MNIKVVTVGKLKESALIQLCAEYEKRLGRFCKISFCELKDKSIPKNANQAQVAAVLVQEGEEILKRLSHSDYVIALCVEGKMLSSEDFAKKISDIVSVSSCIAFVIGGSLGLSDMVKSRADFKLSLSKMTFTHNFARLFLTEQIYRAFKIGANEEYHK